MDRIGRLGEYIDGVISHMDDPTERRSAYIHLYGVSMACALIAAKRGEDVELATMAGMLHDLFAYKAMVHENHAYHGSLLASEVLDELNLATAEEKAIICSAIRNHSDKGTRHSSFDEVLVDADVLHHCLYNPTQSVMTHERIRWESLKHELALTIDI